MKSVPQKNVVQEITAILQAEFECAESLKATSVEIHRLLESGKYDQMSERLNARGEILQLMVSLDKQWSALAKGYLDKIDADEWQTICQKGKQLKDMLQILTCDNTDFEQQLYSKYQETSQVLQTLSSGKKVIRNYSRSVYQLNSPQCTGVAP